jgi:hypothetical protein
MGLLLLLRELALVNVRNLPFDDGLFVGRAESLIGNTEKALGSTRGFNPLVKGQVYPFILEISNFLNTNPLVFVLALYWITLIILIAFLYYYLRDVRIIMFFMLFVVLDSGPFSAQASRIGRELFYGITVLFLFALLVKLKFLFSQNTHKIQITSKVIYGILLGLILFLANNTREERPWIYLILITGIIWVVGLKIKSINQFIVILLVFIASYFILNQGLKIYNQNIFGVKLTSTTIEGEFPKLMSNLSAISTDEKFNPYVSISEGKRKIAYENSPSFKLLGNYLEGEGKAWIQFGCENSQTCDDYANGWFHVALRVAIDDLGYWITQEDAQDFMTQINKELEIACISGNMKCANALPLAKALGVTTITKDQLINSISFLNFYMEKSILGWNRGSIEFGPYEVMDEKQWERWKFVVKSLPESQVEYQNRYNNRVSIFNPIYLNWVKFNAVLSIIGLLFFLFTLFRLIFHKEKFKKSELVLISIAFFALFIWFSRGVLLALNSATNFISISENYALSGRVFLPIALAIFTYLGVKVFWKEKNEK